MTLDRMCKETAIKGHFFVRCPDTNMVYSLYFLDPPDIFFAVEVMGYFFVVYS